MSFKLHLISITTGTQSVNDPDMTHVNINSLNKDDACTICMRNFYEKDVKDMEIVETHCNHYFHKKCLMDHRDYPNKYNMNPLCPLCRRSLLTKSWILWNKDAYDIIDPRDLNIDTKFIFNNSRCNPSTDNEL